MFLFNKFIFNFFPNFMNEYTIYITIYTIPTLSSPCLTALISLQTATQGHDLSCTSITIQLLSLFLLLRGFSHPSWHVNGYCQWSVVEATVWLRCHGCSFPVMPKRLEDPVSQQARWCSASYSLQPLSPVDVS